VLDQLEEAGVRRIGEDGDAEGDRHCVEPTPRLCVRKEGTSDAARTLFPIAALLVLLAIVAGAFLPTQGALNARLAHYVGGPLRASLVSFVVGALVLLVVVAVAARGGTHRVSEVPWWAWIGGALGAFYVASTVAVAPRIGAAAFFGILVAAQLVMSLVIDRFGLLGFPQRGLAPARIGGVALLVAGALLVRLF
jgi:transporter family-2 protein